MSVVWINSIPTQVAMPTPFPGLTALLENLQSADTESAITVPSAFLKGHRASEAAIEVIRGVLSKKGGKVPAASSSSAAAAAGSTVQPAAAATQYNYSQLKTDDDIWSVLLAFLQWSNPDLVAAAAANAASAGVARLAKTSDGKECKAPAPSLVVAATNLPAPLSQLWNVALGRITPANVLTYAFAVARWMPLLAAKGNVGMLKQVSAAAASVLQKQLDPMGTERDPKTWHVLFANLLRVFSAATPMSDGSLSAKDVAAVKALLQAANRNANLK